MRIFNYWAMLILISLASTSSWGQNVNNSLSDRESIGCNVNNPESLSNEKCVNRPKKSKPVRDPKEGLPPCKSKFTYEDDCKPLPLDLDWSAQCFGGDKYINGKCVTPEKQGSAPTVRKISQFKLNGEWDLSEERIGDKCRINYHGDISFLLKLKPGGTANDYEGTFTSKDTIYSEECTGLKRTESKTGKISISLMNMTNKAKINLTFNQSKMALEATGIVENRWLPDGFTIKVGKTSDFSAFVIARP